MKPTYEELETQCAVMRECIEDNLVMFRKIIQLCQEKTVIDGFCSTNEEIKAISYEGSRKCFDATRLFDAGREVLERMHKLERFVDAYKNYRQVKNKTFGCGQCTLATIRGKGYCGIHENDVSEASGKLEQALAALEGVNGK